MRHTSFPSHTAVLVAIAIPVFTTQLKKSQLATATANVRSEYAEIAATAIGNGDTTVKVNKASMSAIAQKVNSDITITFSDGANMVIALDGQSNTIDVDDDVSFE